MKNTICTGEYLCVIPGAATYGPGIHACSAGPVDSGSTWRLIGRWLCECRRKVRHMFVVYLYTQPSMHWCDSVLFWFMIICMLTGTVMISAKTLKNPIDDVIAHSDGFENQLKTLRDLFERLRHANLKIKPSKTRFYYTNVEFLSHTISTDSIRPMLLGQC